MDTNKINELMIDYLADSLSSDEKLAFEQFLKEHPNHQKEFNELSSSWNALGDHESPDPSKEMDAKFYSMLDDYKEQTSTRSSFSLNFLFDPLFTFFTQNNNQWLYRLAMLVIGLGLGYTLNFNANGNDIPQLAQLETQEVRESLVLTLLEQPAANKRMQALNETNKLDKVNETIVDALLKTLNNDDNVNVRLAAIESLLLFADEPIVREGLVKSIRYQEDPMVQVTIAKVMVALQEKGAREELHKLLEKEDLNSSVREELEKSVQSLT